MKMSANIKNIIIRTVREAAMIVLLSLLVSVIVNVVRAKSLDWVATKPYEIFVPCPEALGSVEMISPEDERLADGRSIFIDARSSEEYTAWHHPGAISLVYDYLEPVPEETMQYMLKNIAQSGMARVIVYGDSKGEQGSSGYELGRELSGRGIKHVFVVSGGFEALKENAGAGTQFLPGAGQSPAMRAAQRKN